MRTWTGSFAPMPACLRESHTERAAARKSVKLMPGKASRVAKRSAAPARRVPRFSVLSSGARNRKLRRLAQRLRDDAVALGQLEQRRELLLGGAGVEVEA